MPRRKLTPAAIRRLVLATPGVVEGTAYGRPVFRHGDKLIGSIRPDGQSMMFKLSLETREHLMRADPRTFFITDHYRNFPSVLARIERLSAADIKALLARAIEQAGSKRRRSSSRS
jgi:hypothetical protein